jgi:fructoselysine-6-P-deglycase FrlB-like protein/hydroxymethylpyrimidine pyrophosphatase-like HAD family hydrolase
MTTRFTEKLERLPDTVGLLSDLDTRELKTAIAAGRNRHAIAVGSGGSTIIAEFFARCRETLSHGPTSVETPMQFVLGDSNIKGSDVWLFSAGADNPDIVAAVRAASSRRVGSLNIVTRGPSGAAASEVAGLGGRVHVVPVVDESDGYLATHSLIAAIGALLIAFDGVSNDSVGSELVKTFVARVRDALAPEVRARARLMFETLSAQDLLIVAADPQLRPISVLLETSAWEAALCPVQSTDFRNFSHGRHAWIHHRGDRTIVLALTGRDSRKIWQPLAAALPPAQRQLQIDFGDCGRFANAVGIVEGLVLIEAVGVAVGIDPGKPGIGPFGRDMYANGALREVAATLGPAVRQKRAATLSRDDPAHSGASLPEIQGERIERLAGAVFGGLVLDYDGTIVPTDHRYDPPPLAVMDELARLHRAGLRIGIATGRGGSAGEDLRRALPVDMHSAVLVGYYNGGYLRMLNVDINQEPAPATDGIEEVAGWLDAHPDFFHEFRLRRSGVQITIDTTHLIQPERFAADLAECPPIADGRVIIARSGHSFDVLAAGASKLNVVRDIGDSLDDGKAVLCIGDSGSRHGNDNALLANHWGISVGDVCGIPTGCWSLFGDHLTGPDALLKVLRALAPSEDGWIRLDMASLMVNKDR